MTALQARQPAGAPTGGQFATTTRDEATVSLARQPWDEPPLAPGVTDDDRDHYTRRHCEQLAWALHEATGWPYAGVCDVPHPTTGRWGWLHLAVLAPDGHVVDVEGRHDVHSVLDTYGQASDDEDGEAWLVTSPDTSKYAAGDEVTAAMTDQDKARARRVAAALLAHHYPQEPTREQ